MRWFVNYGFVDATYESAETLGSVVEPDGIQVQEGDRIPGIPEHNLKVGADWAILPKWSVGGTLIYASDQFLRGDDSNKLDTVEDYAIVNLRTRFEPWKHIEVFARIDNLFDSDYETGGIRNLNAFAAPIAEERFLAPRRAARRLGGRQDQVLGSDPRAGVSCPWRARILTIGLRRRSQDSGVPQDPTRPHLKSRWVVHMSRWSCKPIPVTRSARCGRTSACSWCRMSSWRVLGQDRFRNSSTTAFRSWLLAQFVWEVPSPTLHRDAR